MSLPRPVIAGETLLVTRRCVQRQFLLRPSATVNGIIGYCLAVAAERYGVRVHAFCVLSNHLHQPRDMGRPLRRQLGDVVYLVTNRTVEVRCARWWLETFLGSTASRQQC
ncbi:MAG: hypothetical protein IPG96_14555 [Proteobacteria bacterium]|nr:hypothetical protein [Pseudomonadota bacterium]